MRKLLLLYLCAYAALAQNLDYDDEEVVSVFPLIKCHRLQIKAITVFMNTSISFSDIILHLCFIL